MTCPADPVRSTNLHPELVAVEGLNPKLIFIRAIWVIRGSLTQFSGSSREARFKEKGFSSSRC